jgi:hypothetical protein
MKQTQETIEEAAMQIIKMGVFGIPKTESLCLVTTDDESFLWYYGIETAQVLWQEAQIKQGSLTGLIPPPHVTDLSDCC